jgi:uncharacterized RDD family membrane protein YckC
VGLLVSPALGGFTTTSRQIIDGTVTTVTTTNGAVQLFNFLLSAGYFIGFWTYGNGQTLGMRALRLRVVRAEDGHPITLGGAVIRYIGLFISFLVIFIGVIWVAIDPRRQGWHDKMASSFVVQQIT